MGNKLDYQAMYGKSAEGEALGLYNDADVNSIASLADGNALGAFADCSGQFDQFLYGLYLIQAANGPGAEKISVIMSPREKMTMNRFKDGEGKYYSILPADCAKMKWFETNQIANRVQGSATNARDIFEGDFSQLWIAVRSPITLSITREASDSANSAFVLGQRWLKATLRADTMAIRPAHFTKITGIIV